MRTIIALALSVITLPALAAPSSCPTTLPFAAPSAEMSAEWGDSDYLWWLDIQTEAHCAKVGESAASCQCARAVLAAELAAE
jgi:hypothetical protein